MQEIFAKKYPQIAFFLQITPFSPWTLLQEENKKWNGKRGDLFLYLSKRSQGFIPESDLEHKDVLYLFGLGLGEEILYFQKWLQEDPKRFLVAICDDLSHIDLFLQSPLSEKIIEMNNVKIQYIGEGVSHKDFISELALAHPTQKIDFGVLDHFDKKKAKRWSLDLLRKSVASSHYFAEARYLHKLSHNLMQNLFHLSKAFYVNRWRGHFKGIPAIICGAGPSLKKEVRRLKKLENNALIISCGSALSPLSQAGVLPHLALATDPNPQEFLFLKKMQAFEIPFIYQNRLHASLFSLINGPYGYLTMENGGVGGSWFDEQLNLLEEPIGSELSSSAFSVTTLAIALAEALGCSPIILVGVDLAFTDNRRYAKGLLEKDDKLDIKKVAKEAVDVEGRPLFRKSVSGKRVVTSVKWVMESSAIGTFAKLKRDCPFFNCSLDGLPIENFTSTSLSNVASKWLKRDFDIRGKVHTLIQQTSLSLTRQEIEKPLLDLERSLDRSMLICSQILQEIHSKTTLSRIFLYEMDLQEELIYGPFLRWIDHGIRCQLAQEEQTKEYHFKRWSLMNEALIEFKDHFPKYAAHD